MTNSKLRISEAISIILSVFFAHSIMSMPRDLLVTTKSGTIINIIFIGIISLLVVILIYKLMKNFSSGDILDISEYVGGTVFKKIMGFIFIGYFIISSSMILRNFAECLKIVYYPMTDLIFIILAFVIVLCIIGKFEISTIAKISLILVPFVILTVLFIFFANIENFSVSNSFPIIGEGAFNTFILGLGNLGAFGGISFLYFLPPLLNKPKEFKKISIISIGIAIVYLILCVATILFMFDFLLQLNEIMPLYSASRHIEFGSFFQRLESIFLLIWILQIICYITLCLMFSLYIFKKITNTNDKKPMVFSFALLIFAISFLPKNYAISSFIERNIYKYIVIVVSFILVPSILILANIKKKKRKVIEENDEVI